jgi:pimeloyl-ACP methyl ester carboxylesterase
VPSHPEPPAVADWRAAGRQVPVDTRVGPSTVFVADRPAADDATGEPPLLVLHGFPTCSFDYAACLPALAARRRVVIPDHLGHGLSAKPDVRYGVRMLADAAEAAVVALGIDEVDLLTHDVGDSVGGELLARDLEGELGFSVRRRVLTNGSIYMDLVQLSDGQRFLLSLPDEPTDLITEELWIGGLRATFAPGSAVSDDELADQWAFYADGDGQRMLARTIRYIEDRQVEERRYTEPIEVHPSPLGVVWGRHDPIAVHAMAERLVEARPGTPLVTLEHVGHYPMVEDPAAFSAAVLTMLDHDRGGTP